MDKESGISAKKRKLKKIAKIAAIAFISVIVVFVILYVVSFFLKKSDVGEPNTSGIYFYEADYNLNIFEDKKYMSSDRSVYYFEYGSGEPITSENINDLPEAAKFFEEYFRIVINGEYEKYPLLFTEKYKQYNKIPQPFTKQKVYDIQVELTDQQTVNEDGKEILANIYTVRYKIKDNNGTFRSDIGSNTNKPLIFVLYKSGDSFLINSISTIQYKQE